MDIAKKESAMNNPFLLKELHLVFREYIQNMTAGRKPRGVIVRRVTIKNSCGNTTSVTPAATSTTSFSRTNARII